LNQVVSKPCGKVHAHAVVELSAFNTLWAFDTLSAFDRQAECEQADGLLQGTLFWDGIRE
jgi:hypothetical protein